MTSIDDLKRDVKNVSDKQLGDLSTKERLRIFMQEAAEGDEERIEWLTDTAPKHKYTATDIEYTQGAQQLATLSLGARYELQKLYQAISRLEAARDRDMALMMLNESLGRLSRGSFDVDEFGNLDAPDHADADYAYGERRAPDTALLATRYRELWEDLPAELLVDEDDREMPHLPNLAATALLGYPSDLSAYDVDEDRVSSEVYLSEVRLVNALVEFHTRFHGWRLFAEEHLDTTLDELLNISLPTDEKPPTTYGVPEIDEQLCRNTLSLKRDYLEAISDVLEEWAEEGHEITAPTDGEEFVVDLDARAEAYASQLAEDVDLPL